MRYAIDPTKIHNELGWLPETKFADGIKKTIKWYLENREWWETIISGEYQNYYEKMYGNREEVRNPETAVTYSGKRKQRMKVLVTGAKGQLGTDLMNELAKSAASRASAWMSRKWTSPTRKPAAVCHHGGWRGRGHPLCRIYCSRRS